MMQLPANRRVLSASAIGAVLVGGALVLNYLQSDTAITGAVTRDMAQAVQVPERDFIAVVDQNGDGIEDWREEFITEAAITLPASTSASTYEYPKTLTDQVGIQLFQSSIRDKSLGKYGRGNETIIQDTTKDIAAVVQDKLYTNRDVVPVPTTPDSIVTYGNSMGYSLITHNVADAEWELTIVNRALDTNNPAELAKLQPLADMYKKLRDDALNTPVPDKFTTNHLNLINSYNALYKSITDLQLIFTDPMVSLLRIKRYEDDAKGLRIALHNIYQSAIPYESLFKKDDPALVFVTFANL
jgi:hypothetical protein